MAFDVNDVDALLERIRKVLDLMYISDLTFNKDLVREILPRLKVPKALEEQVLVYIGV